MMNGLDLFSGIGGLTVALEKYVKPIAYCENDRYAQAVLMSRMWDGRIPVAPIWDDVRTLGVSDLGRTVDIIYGGFPCQDISVAGPGGGLEGERSGLFVHIIRLAKEIKPTFIFLENVPAIRTRGLGVVLRELSEIGYDARWTVVSAEEVGAPHRRERFFLLAHANGLGLGLGLRKQSGWGGRKKRQEKNEPKFNGDKESLAHSHGSRESSGTEKGNESRNGVIHSGQDMAHSDRINEHDERYGASPVQSCKRKATVIQKCGWWESEPNVDRVVNGLPFRLDRIKALGNSVVPAQAREAFERLIGLK